MDKKATYLIKVVPKRAVYGVYVFSSVLRLNAASKCLSFCEGIEVHFQCTDQ
uniref:Transposase n=1 Tax=Steinernema glaseri TaxID=37863 RepID=A0A1I7Z2Z3_9BILA